MLWHRGRRRGEGRVGEGRGRGGGRQGEGRGKAGEGGREEGVTLACGLRIAVPTFPWRPYTLSGRLGEATHQDTCCRVNRQKINGVTMQLYPLHHYDITVHLLL